MTDRGKMDDHSNFQAKKKTFTVESSWGVASIRQCAGFPTQLLKRSSLDVKNSPCYVCPLGSLIVCWDIANHERKVSFQAHDDLITVMLYNSSLEIIITGSFSGELKFWDEDFRLKLSQNVDAEELHFASLSENGDKLLLIYHKSGDSYLAFYDIGFDPKNGHLIVSLKWKIHVKTEPKSTSKTVEFAETESKESDLGCQLDSVLAQDISEARTSEARSVHSFELELPDVQPVTESTDKMMAEKQSSSPTFVKTQDGYVITLFTPQDNMVALFQRHGHFSEAHMYDVTGSLFKTQVLDPLGDKNSSIMCTSPCHNGMFATGFQGGIFLILNEVDLSVLSLLQATGSSQVALWDHDYLMAFSYLSGHISWWTAGGELVNEIEGGPKGSIIHLDWAIPGKELWVGGIMSLHYVTLENENVAKGFPSKLTEKYQLQFHQVTACGVAFTSDNDIVSGDFAGNIFMWKKDDVRTVARTRCSSAVRCITWKNGAAYCGSLDGTLSKWIPHEPLVQVLSCAGSVLNMAWTENSSNLAIGLDSGHLTVYKFDSVPVELLNIAAHHIKREGVEIPAEIWSVCWSPCENMIATASEDQTTCIWNAADGKKLHTLAGHTTAVTSVDWKRMSSGDIILATCADDRTVRVRDGQTFEMVHVLSIPEIRGWYTLTYLSLDPVRHHCLCSTQNGFIVLWDVLKGDRLACWKMHSGSVEGLVWDKEFRQFATVSSDCVVNLFTVS